MGAPKTAVVVDLVSVESGRSQPPAQPYGDRAMTMADVRVFGPRDATDGKLISLLQRNARMTLTGLARELALSRTAVQARMARLERERVIVAYRAVIDERRGRDEDSLSAVLSVTFSPGASSAVAQTFRDWPEITKYYSVTGPPAAFMVVRVSTAADLARFLDHLSAVPGVEAVRSAVVLKAGLD